MKPLRKARKPLGHLPASISPLENQRFMTVRVGCRLVYETNQPTPIFLFVRPRLENGQFMLQEKLTFRCDEGAEQFEDGQGNITHRWTLQPGQTVIVHDALVQVSPLADDFNPKTFSV